MSQTEITAEFLSQPGNIEILVREGRDPYFEKAVGSSGMVLFFPPEGARGPGRIIIGTDIEFFSRDGESRGKAIEVIVDNELGESLRARTKAVLEELGLAESYKAFGSLPF